MTTLGKRSTIGRSDLWHRIATSLRACGDQILVLAVLVAIWQVLSMTLGSYWVGSPWGVATRFVAGIGDGTLLHQASYTVIEAAAGLDRKSTRLNSSHLGISYAVFCLKKKKKKQEKLTKFNC